jgi:hypothetical protein
MSNKRSFGTQSEGICEQGARHRRSSQRGVQLISGGSISTALLPLAFSQRADLRADLAAGSGFTWHGGFPLAGWPDRPYTFTRSEKVAR